jgi:MFS family permease
LLDPHWLPVNLVWRLGFGIGALIGLGIMLLRHAVPESPRWLLTHGKANEAERVVSQIERKIEAAGALPRAEGTITIQSDTRIWFGAIVATMVRTYPKRTVLCLALVISQAFLYNGVAFSFGLILRNFYKVPTDRVGLYLLPFALTNFLGPLVLGRLFDTVGRKPMIAGTFAASAGLLAVSGLLFASGGSRREARRRSGRPSSSSPQPPPAQLT